MPKRRRSHRMQDRRQRKRGPKVSDTARAAIGQYYGLTLQGLSSERPETLGDEKDKGWGIVKIVGESPLRGAWMQPTTDRSDCIEWSATGEYTLDPTQKWDLDSEDIKAATGVIIHDMPAYALGRRLPSAMSSTEGYEQASQGFLDRRRRFTRSKVCDGNVVERQYTECSECTLPLGSLDMDKVNFVHCKRCDSVYHNDCTEGRGRQPFQLREDKFCDNAGIPIACPKCSVEGVEEEAYLQATIKTVDKPIFLFKACFDVGTNVLKASTMMTGHGSRSDDQHVTITQSVASCFWIDQLGESDPFVVVDTDADGPATLTEKAVRYAPIKKILYDRPTQDALQRAGTNPKDCLNSYFALLFKQLLIERKSQVEAWSAAAKQGVRADGEHCVEISLSIAAPAGLTASQKAPLETALLQAGMSFAASLDLEACRPLVTSLSEPEAAFIGAHNQNPWSQGGDNRQDDRYMIIDLGGSTTDATIMSIHELQQPYQTRRGPHHSIDSGTSRLVSEIMRSDIGGWKQRQVTRWVQEATTTEPESAVCCGKDITKLWHEMREQQRAQLTSWLKQYCEAVEEVYGVGTKLKCVLTGGGTTDSLVRAVVYSTLEHVLPMTQIMEYTSTHQHSSDVLVGLQRYAKRCDDLRLDPSPVTILLQQHADNDPENSEESYVIITNQHDPRGPHPILSNGQLSSGDFFTYTIDWNDDLEETSIRFYAQHKRIETPVLVQGLANAPGSKIDSSELYPIASLAVQKAPNTNGPTVVALGVYPNPLGRTVQVVVHNFDTDLAPDIQSADARELHEIASSTLELVGSLDVHKAESVTRMTCLEFENIAGDAAQCLSGRMPIPVGEGDEDGDQSTVELTDLPILVEESDEDNAQGIKELIDFVPTDQYEVSIEQS